jgi:hypothetical protein
MVQPQQDDSIFGLDISDLGLSHRLLKTSFETKCGEPVILYRHFTGVNCSDTIA